MGDSNKMVFVLSEMPYCTRRRRSHAGVSCGTVTRCELSMACFMY